jgi:hypothetical protein
MVDGRPLVESRWRLAPGTHTIRAASADGSTDEVRVVVR